MNSHQQRMQRRFVLRVHARLAATIPGLIAGLYKKHHHEVPKKVFTDLEAALAQAVRALRKEA